MFSRRKDAALFFLVALVVQAHQSAAEFNETLLQKAENGEWIIPASDKKMYKIIYIEQPSSPVSAEKLCDTENAHLASVHSEDENLLLYDLLEELATRRNPKAIQYAYIGLYQKVGVKEFEWSDSSPVNFSKWRPDEPQEQPNHEKLCGTIVLYSRLYKYRDFYKGWAALGCETKGPSNYAVCQK